MVFVSRTGRAFPIVVNRRKGARLLRLCFGVTNELKLSAPLKVTDKCLQSFINSSRDWLEDQIAKLPVLLTLGEWFIGNPSCSVNGVRLPVRVIVSEDSRVPFQLKKAPAELHFYPSDHSDLALIKVARRAAKKFLTARSDIFAKQSGLNFSRLSIRDQKTRWGSCSSKGAISLNWRLLLIDPALQDYVIHHELTHLSEMNHGCKFWSLLERYDPHFNIHDKRLSEIGPTLLRVGRG